MPESLPAAKPGAAAESIRGQEIHVFRHALPPQRRADLVRFWLDHGAIPDEAEARRRTQEVVCLALDPEDRISGVSTVYIDGFGPEREPCWFYRTFIRPDCRVPGLAIRLLRVTLQCLAQEPAGRDEMPRALVIVTENRRLTHPVVRRMLRAEGLRHLGQTAGGMDVWKHDFPS